MTEAAARPDQPSRDAAMPDSPTSVGENFWTATEDFVLESVPEDRRKNWISIALVMTGVGINVTSLILGITLANGMSTADAVAAVLLGSLLLGVLGVFCSIVGSRTGLSTPMITYFAFGRAGARAVALLLGVVSLGWFGVQAGFLGNNLSSALDGFDIHIPAWSLALAGGVLMTCTAVIGYGALERLSRWAVPLMVGLILIALSLLVMRGSPHPIPLRAARATMQFPTAVAFVFSILVSAAATFPDLSRYALRTRDAAIGAFVGLLFGNSIMLLLAIVLARYTGEADLMRLFATVNMGVAAVLVLTLSQWVTNAANLYSASLAFPVMAPEARIPKAIYAIVAGALGTLLGASGIAGHFLEFLLILSISITPIGGAYVGYYFVTLRGQFPSNPPNVVVVPTVAWLAGVLCSWLTTPNDPAGSMYGAAMFVLTTVPPVDGFLVALLIVCVVPFARARKGRC